MASERLTVLRDRLKQRFNVAEYNELCTLQAAEQQESAALQDAQPRPAQDESAEGARNRAAGRREPFGRETQAP